MGSSESVEMYLEAIVELDAQSEAVRSVDIARYLGVTKPSVSRAMTNLKAAGLILQEPYGRVTLTEKGRAEADRIHGMHHMITDFFMDALGLDAHIAEADACRIEHVISPETVAAIKAYLKRKR
jgi:Mn-dependent DtxR family transcriptional regulator